MNSNYSDGGDYSYLDRIAEVADSPKDLFKATPGSVATEEEIQQIKAEDAIKALQKEIPPAFLSTQALGNRRRAFKQTQTILQQRRRQQHRR